MSNFINVKVNESFTLPTDSYADLIPGEIIMFPVTSTTLSSDYFLDCDGSVYDADTYPLLNDAIGTRFGNDGDGSPKLPNLNASSDDDCVMIRGDGSMSKKTKINNTSETNTSNKINYLPDHNSQHDFVVNSVNISSFKYNKDSINLNSNNQQYVTGLDTAAKKQSYSGNGKKKLNLSTDDHSHSYKISNKGDIYSHNAFIKTASVNSNQISVSENSTNTHNYVFPSIKLKYYIFVGKNDEMSNANVDDNNSDYDDDSKISTTSSFVNVNVNDSLKVSSNQVISKPNKIIIYAGSTPPSGYVWCDGHNGTPDLTNRFITSTTSSSTVGKYTNNKKKSNTISSLPGHSHTITIDGANVTSHNVNYKANLTYENFGSVKGMKESGVNKNVAWKGNHKLAGNHQHNFTYSNISNNFIAYKHNNNDNSKNIPKTDASGVKSSSIKINQNETNNTSKFIPAYVSIGFIMKET